MPFPPWKVSFWHNCIMFQVTPLWEVLGLVCRSFRCGVTQCQWGLCPEGKTRQSPREFLCDVARLWWVFLFPYLLERQGCVQTCCHIQVHWYFSQKMFVPVSQPLCLQRVPSPLLLLLMGVPALSWHQHFCHLMRSQPVVPDWKITFFS